MDLVEESSGQCIVCRGMQMHGSCRAVMRTVHIMQSYACREPPGSVWNYEGDTVSNGGFNRADEWSKGSLAPHGDSLQYLDFDKRHIT